MAALADILDDFVILTGRVEQSVASRSYADLMDNAEAYDALTYRLAMIGETCNKLSADLKAGIRTCSGVK